MNYHIPGTLGKIRKYNFRMVYHIHYIPECESEKKEQRIMFFKFSKMKQFWFE